MKVMVLGGYGVFGGHLSRMLLSAGHTVFVCGRSQSRVEAFCTEFGGVGIVLDRDDLVQLGALLDRHEVNILIDAAGPFQDYHSDYGVARAALASEVHYLDLSDDAAFSSGITELETEAEQIGCMALSGVSTVPAISSAAVEQLSADIDNLALIDTALLPGNRAPRGRSVMRAILGQVGRPLEVWRGGQWRDAYGWTSLRAFTLPGGLRRLGSVIGAPDVALFPDYFRARSVLFRAGLELGLMHRALGIMGWAVKRRLLPRLDHFTGLFLKLANLMGGFGSDQGGMSVRVCGRDGGGRAIAREWRLVIGQGKGPMIPAIPAALMVDKIATGEFTPGARAAICELSLEELETALHDIGAQTEIEQTSDLPLFEAALSDDWAKMPATWRAAHDLWDFHTMAGEASVERGSGLLSGLIGAVFRFPQETSQVEVEVEMERAGQAEFWKRRFGRDRFRSTLTPAGPGAVFERFGPFKFRLALPIQDGRMQMEVKQGWFLGLELPRAILPISETSEYEEDGRFRFDVRLSVPIAGFIVRYKGWLTPQS